MTYPTYLEGLGGLLVRRIPQIDAVHAEYLVAAFQFAAQIGRPAGQYERHEYTFAVLAAHDVEAQARRALLQHHRSHISVK